MPQIPNTINGVAIEFADTVGNEVHQRVIDGLSACIRTDIASGHQLVTVYVSSASDSHEMPSRHAQQKAVDLSRINGIKIVIGYPQGGQVTAIVEAVQKAFEQYAQRRENYGPFMKKKLGANHAVGGHDDHIHLSVN